MDDLELREQIKTTDDLITSNPVELVFTRPQPAADDGAGGRKPAGQDNDLPPQEVFFQAKMQNPVEVMDERGQRVLSWYVVVGRPDADMRQGDRFMHNGHEYKLAFIYPDRQYQIKAEVVRISALN